MKLKFTSRKQAGGIMALIVLTLSLHACKKDTPTYQSTADLYVVNATVATGGIKVNPGVAKGFYWSAAAALNPAAALSYGSFTGRNNLSVVSSTDTTKFFYNQTVNLAAANTLYITGQAPAIDTLFRNETNLPFISATVIKPDSSIYIRFVNLSPNSPALNINIKTVTSNEVSALSYKGISGFKKYTAVATTANYVFEVRDAATSNLLLTYTASNASLRFHTVSLVLKGLVGATTGADAFAMFQATYL